jgi:hypothetical protein
MDALLTTIALWLTANFALPATSAHPRIAIVPPTEIAARHYCPSSQAAPSGSGQIVAVYDGAQATIYLPTGWTGGTPAELSVLVHELVHHLQKMANLAYECPAAREELAYAAQEKWLNLFGRSLASEFELDPFTVKARTVCGY